MEIHGQIKKQVSTTRPELYKSHPDLQHTKIKTPLYKNGNSTTIQIVITAHDM